MSAAWDTLRRRAAALRGIVDDLERSGGAGWPPDAVGDVFATEDDLLIALHDLWSRRLEARVDLALETDQRPPEESVAAAWRQVAAELPAVRRLLDRHAADPALRASEQHEHRLLALATGRAALGDPLPVAAAAGAAYVDSFRGARVAGGRRRWTGFRLSSSGAA